MKSDFEIRILRLHWILDDGKDDPNDQCIHARVFVRIGDEVLSDENSDFWNIGVTALYLLRSLDTNYSPGDFASQILPCCGHFVTPDESKENFVIIIGCSTGVEWSIKHEKESIVWISEKGSIGSIELKDYKNIVFEMVNEIEKFYKKALPKVIPDDEHDKEGWRQYWAEWNSLKEKWFVSNN